MRWVHIPAVEFSRGIGKNAHPDVEYLDGPEHTVSVEDFQISDTPVTVAQWREFIRLSAYRWSLWDELATVSPTDDHPIVLVSWFDTEAFCQWYSNQFREYVRLPSEAEWELACRGTTGQLFPLKEPGDAYDVLRWWDRLSRGNRPVRDESLHVSPYGCLGMWENIGEWCFDWFSERPLDPAENANPHGPPTGSKRSVRGGCPEDSGCPLCAHRSGSEPELRHHRLGFRIVRGIKFPQCAPNQS